MVEEGRAREIMFMLKITSSLCLVSIGLLLKSCADVAIAEQGIIKRSVDCFICACKPGEYKVYVYDLSLQLFSFFFDAIFSFFYF